MWQIIEDLIHQNKSDKYIIAAAGDGLQVSSQPGDATAADEQSCHTAGGSSQFYISTN